MKNKNIKNDIILKVLNGQSVDRPPVWMMRQAGRFLPEYRKLRSKFSFFERCKNPNLVSKITIMPINIIETDAAIIFSDILVIPQAMGMNVSMIPDFGPKLDSINKKEDIDKFNVPDVKKKLNYVFEGIKQTIIDLDNKVPLIGFAGSPWTVFCYMIQGSGSKDFSKAKEFCLNYPNYSKKLLELITVTTIDYMKGQIRSGIDIFQLFDSWGGILSKKDYLKFSFPYIKMIIDQCNIPNILFAKGCWHSLKEINKLSTNAIGLDWLIEPKYARKILGYDRVVQGNLDPSYLLSSKSKIKRLTLDMINEFGSKNYIVNLGHGILPNTPVENAKTFIKTVKCYS